LPYHYKATTADHVAWIKDNFLLRFVHFKVHGTNLCIFSLIFSLRIKKEGNRLSLI